MDATTPPSNKVREFAAADYRRVLGNYPTGVCVITALIDGEPVGMVVGSFTSLSLDPPLVAYMPDKASKTYATLEGAESFAANFLGSSQEEVCQRLASKTLTDKWSAIAWHHGASGAPLLDDAVGWIECTLENRFEGGDHWIVVGRVMDLGVQSDSLPLLFFQGGYGRFSPSSFVARTELDFKREARIAAAIRSQIEDLSLRTGLECTVAARIGRELVILTRAGSPTGPNPRRVVGLRMPFMPPFGSTFSAWSTEALDLWISQLGSTEDDLITTMHAHVDRVRGRGWSLALRPPDHETLSQHFLDFTAGSYTPAGERDMRESIKAIEGYYEPEIELNGAYEVYTLGAPVFDSAGEVALSIHLIGPSEAVSGAQVEAWADVLQEATKAMTATASGIARE